MSTNRGFQPRKSLLAGQHPVSAPGDYSLHGRTSSQLTDTSLQDEPVVQRVIMQRVTLQLPEDLAEKARTAWQVEGTPRGIRNFSLWVAELLQERIDDLETERGVPFVRTPPGVIPSGRSASQR